MLTPQTLHRFWHFTVFLASLSLLYLYIRYLVHISFLWISNKHIFLTVGVSNSAIVSDRRLQRSPELSAQYYRRQLLTVPLSESEHRTVCSVSKLFTTQLLLCLCPKKLHNPTATFHKMKGWAYMSRRSCLDIILESSELIKAVYHRQ